MTASSPGRLGFVFSEPGGTGIIHVSVRLPLRSPMRKRNQWGSLAGSARLAGRMPVAADSPPDHRSPLMPLRS